MEEQSKLIGAVPPLDWNGPIAHPCFEMGSDWLEKSVWEHFESVAAKNPSKPALIGNSASISYGELRRGAALLGSQLGNCNPEKPVALVLPHSVYYPMAMLACIYAGIPYLPFDIHTPLERRKAINKQAEVQLEIDLDWVLNGLKSELQNTENSAKPESLAYILYTSGSSGQPKGVFQNQRNLLHDVGQYIQSVHLNKDDKLSLLYHPSVNGAIRDIYGALLTGAGLYLYDLKEQGFANLENYLIHNSISIYHSLPTIFRGFLRLAKSVFPKVRLVYLAGDRILGSDAQLFQQHFNQSAFLYVGIGSTENATIYRQRFISPTAIPEETLLKLGYAVPDRSMELLDEDGSRVGEGQVGEIVVTSEFMALGYWNDPAQTEKHFEWLGTQRRFKTGDLGRLHPDGQLEFLGRKDRQVKINGFRVEAGELEAVLKQLESVVELSVVFRAQKETIWPVVYYQSNGNSNLNKELDQLAKAHLPSYAQPKLFVRLEEFPRLGNFKLDYSALKQIDENRSRYETPNLPEVETSIIGEIRAVWSRYLPLEFFEQNLGFEDAGGDSMSFVHFLADIQNLLNREIPLQRWGKNFRPSQLLEWIDTAEEEDKTESVLYFFPDWNYKPEFLKLAAEAEAFSKVVLVTYQPDYPIETGFDLLVKQYAWLEKPEQIRGFVALCRGSQLAQRIAQYIEKERGMTIPLILLDAFPMYKPIKHVLDIPLAIYRGEWGWYEAKKLVMTKLGKWFGWKFGRGTEPNPKLYKTYAVPTSLYLGPTLLIRAEITLKPRWKKAGGWEDFLPNLQVVWLKGKDHYNFLDDNRDFINREIVNFLSRLKLR
ncbi:MAG: non-ribosomal peptide synthetase [Bacteroidia bacterium]|nr:non-ribosomal peptide synthetase [Bacteroidia bacterium]